MEQGLNEPSESDSLKEFNNMMPSSNKKIVYSLEEVYDEIGGFGKAQAFGIAQAILSLTGSVFLVSNLVFFELFPKEFQCEYSANPGVQVQCSTEDICYGENKILNWDIPNTYTKNFVKDFDLVCESKFQIGLIGSMFFFGEAAAALFYTSFSIKYQETRIKHIQLKNIVSTLVLIYLLFFARDVMSLYQGIFILGFCQSIGIIQGYAYNCEILPHRYRNAASTSIGLFDKFLFLLTTLFQKYHATHWILITFPALICAIAATVMSFMLFDSPQYYHDKKEFEKSKKCFKEIAVWNGIYDFDHEFKFQSELNSKERQDLNYLTLIIQAEDDGIELEEPHRSHEDHPLVSPKQKRRYSVIKESIFNTKIEVVNYVLVLFVFSIAILNENLLQFSLKTYAGDIYNNTIILVFAGLFASYFAFSLITQFQPALALSLAFGIMTISGLSYPQIHRFQEALGRLGSIDASAYIILWCAKLGATSVHQLANLFIIWKFNSKQTSFVLASTNLASRLMAVLAPEIGELEEPIPMILFGFSAAVCGFICFVVYLGEKADIIKNVDEKIVKV